LASFKAARRTAASAGVVVATMASDAALRTPLSAENIAAV